MTDEERATIIQRICNDALERKRVAARAYEKKYRDKNKAVVYEKNAAYWARNPGLRTHYRLRRLYGISLEERNEMFRRQGSVCASCGVSEPGGVNGWNVDHCHTTGQVRGVLCHNCNSALGQAKECPNRLRKLADYIERYTKDERSNSTRNNGDENG